MFKKLSILILIIFFIYGCGPTVPKKQINKPIIIGANYDKVFLSSIRALQNNDYVIKNTDKQTGFISTDWKEGKNLFLRYRTKYEIVLEKISNAQTRLILNPIAQFWNVNQWEPLNSYSKKNVEKFKKLINEIRSLSEN